MHWRLEQLKDRWIHQKVFSDLRDVRTYKRLRYAPRGLTDPQPLHIRALGGRPVLCRPGTTDSKVLWDTFYHQHHRPPRRPGAVRTIVDLGANVGYTVLDLASQFPNARIIAVEMDSANADLCRRNIRNLEPRCRLVQAAVWTENGTIQYAGDEAWSLSVSQSASHDERAKQRTAPARLLESIFDEFNLDTVDYLKMDIEGTEAAVLRSPAAWADRVRIIKAELHPPAEYQACADALRACGFRCGKDHTHPNCLVARRR